MDTAIKPDTEVSVPVQGNGLATNFESGTATLLLPSTAPNGGETASAWWDHIKALDHYDPAYLYAPRHVYGPDWTNDDAYGKDGVHFMAGPSHQTWDTTRGVWLDPMRAGDLAADEARQAAVQETAARTQVETRMILIHLN